MQIIIERKRGFLEYVIELEESTATVSQAAEALGVEPGRIAKTMSFLQGEQPVLILTEGPAKIDNRKYKNTFHVKAKMIPFEEVEEMVGHALAAGNSNSAVELTISQLEQAVEAKGWVDVCKEISV